MAGWAPARADVIAEYAREILEVHPRGRLLVGVDGIEFPADEPPSARAAFSRELVAALTAERVQATDFRMADYAVGPSDGRLDPALLPERLYDVDRFRAEVLQPYRAGTLGFAASDGEGWTIDLEQSRERMIAVVHGAFLHHGDLAGMWHTSAWIRQPRAVARRSDAERLGVEEADPALDGWYAAVDRSFRRLDARKLANATFDLTDPEHPRREFEDAC